MKTIHDGIATVASSCLNIAFANGTGLTGTSMKVGMCRWSYNVGCSNALRKIQCFNSSSKCAFIAFSLTL